MKGCTYGATLEELLKRPTGLFALHGRDGEDGGAKPGSESEEDESKDDGAKPGDDDKSKKKDDDKGDGKDKDETPTVASLTRQLESAKEGLARAADKRDEFKTKLAEATTKIAQMEKDGSPDETIKQENETLKSTNATLVQDNERLRLEMALRDDKAHNWVNPGTVLKLVDLTDVDFDAKTGQPRGLKAALDKLAKDSPFLLAPKDDEDDSKPGPTGKPPAPRQKTTTAQQAEQAELRRKYPALRRR